METLVKDLLENVVGRLTKIETQQEAQLMRESQIGQVIERLDTIHNRQTQLEHKLSDVSTQLGIQKTSMTDKLSTISTQLEQEKVFMRDQLLSTISTQLEQEKVFMRDQLKEAQDEILHRLTELQQQNVSTRSQTVSVGEEMKQLQATAGPNPVKETAEFCSQTDGDVMDARLAKMSETLEQSVKAAIGVEAIWLSNQTDQMIVDIGATMAEKFFELGRQVIAFAEQNMNIKRDNEEMISDIKTEMNEEIRALREAVHKSLTDIGEKNNSSLIEQQDNMKTFYTEIVTQIKKVSDEQPKILDAAEKVIKDHMETVKAEITADTNTALVKVKDEYIETQNQTLQDVQKQIDTKGNKCMEKVTDELAKVKEELMKNTNSACLTLKDTVIKAQTEAIQNTQGHIETAVKKSTMQVTGELGKVKEELFKNTNSACLTMKDTVIKSQTGTIQNTQGQIETAVKESTMKVTGELGKVKEELLKNTNSACQKLKDEVNKSHRETIQNIQSQIETSVKEATTKVTDHMGKTKEELCSVTNSESKKLRDAINSQDETIQKTQGTIQSTVKESVDKVHTNLYTVYRDLDKTKRDLVAFIEGQSQIVRDRIAGPLPQHKNYVCDFYIDNFRQLVRSGKDVTSLPWHINQFDSSVRGNADFTTSGKMKVWLVYGRWPHQLGLQPRSGVRLKSKATIINAKGQLPDLVVGETTSSWKEENIQNNSYWGGNIGEMSCDELIEKGYGDKEDYMNDALLVRYEIEVL